MHTSSTRQSARGFTLLEVVIVVAIVGILAAFAVPNYLKHVQQTRRTDATVLLTEAAGEQFRFYSEFNTYAGDMSTLGYADNVMTSDEGFYNVVVESAGAVSFVLVATPVNTEAQASDTECPELRIDSAGLKSPADCW